jgi:segregation and condensation protein B
MNDAHRNTIRSAASAKAPTSFLSSSFEDLKRRLEAILFSAEAPLDLGEFKACLGDISKDDVRLALKGLGEDCEGRSFFLFESGGRFQFRTRPEWSDVVAKQFAVRPRSLSKAAIETLAIVAYRQPITRAEINNIRGADSASIVATLKEKDLLAVAGVRKEVGNPLEFKTTPKFLEVFGLASLKDMPSLRSLQMKPDDRAQVQKSLLELDAIAAGEENNEIILTERDLALLPPEEVDQATASVL